MVNGDGRQQADGRRSAMFVSLEMIRDAWPDGGDYV